jgi:hypothetical protein
MLRTQDLSHAVKMWVRIPASLKNWREKMNQLMAEKISKIIKIPKWGKSQQKIILKNL